MQTHLAPTTVYLNEAQQKQIKFLSVTMKAPKAEVTRLIIYKGIEVVQKERVVREQAMSFCANNHKIPINYGYITK